MLYHRYGAGPETGASAALGGCSARTPSTPAVVGAAVSEASAKLGSKIQPLRQCVCGGSCEPEFSCKVSSPACAVASGKIKTGICFLKLLL